MIILGILGKELAEHFTRNKPMTEQELNDIDRLLAEKVMEWHTETIAVGPDIAGDYWFPASWKGGQHPELECYHVSDWHPTRCIEQAMMVAEKIGGHIELIRMENGLWRCLIWFGLSQVTGERRDTPALAICLAAQEWVRSKE